MQTLLRGCQGANENAFAILQQNLISSGIENVRHLLKVSSSLGTRSKRIWNLKLLSLCQEILSLSHDVQ